MAARTPAYDDELPDGIYLNLHQDIYFRQKDRLGSSDLMRLDKDREGWWWQSPHNPDRADNDSVYKNYGSALHCVLLEGMKVYRGRWMVRPDPKDYPHLLVTIPDIRNALKQEGVKLRGISEFTKEDWCAAAHQHIPHRHVWDTINNRFEARRVVDRLPTGEAVLRPALTAVEDRMLGVMYDAAMDDPEIRELLLGTEETPSLAEVSFFWTDELTGIKRRARFDKPVPSFTLDLKSIGNWEGRDLVQHVGDTIQRMRYDIQLGDQHDARRHMHRMIQLYGEKCIHGGTATERTWLLAIATRDMPFSWVWLFYQKPEPRGVCPIIFPVREAWGGPYHRSGYRKARRALDLFTSYVDRFGLGPTPDATGRPSRPWTRVEPLHHTAPVPGHEDLPIVTLPTWGFDEYPVDGELDHFREGRA